MHILFHFVFFIFSDSYLSDKILSAHIQVPKNPPMETTSPLLKDTPTMLKVPVIKPHHTKEECTLQPPPKKRFIARAANDDVDLANKTSENSEAFTKENVSSEPLDMTTRKNENFVYHYSGHVLKKKLLGETKSSLLLGQLLGRGDEPTPQHWSNEERNTCSPYPIKQEHNKTKKSVLSSIDTVDNLLHSSPTTPDNTDQLGLFPSCVDGKRFVCGLCGGSFSFQTNLTRHQRKLHGKPPVRRSHGPDMVNSPIV